MSTADAGRSRGSGGTEVQVISVNNAQERTNMQKTRQKEYTGTQKGAHAVRMTRAERARRRRKKQQIFLVFQTVFFLTAVALFFGVSRELARIKSAPVDAVAEEDEKQTAGVLKSEDNLVASPNQGEELNYVDLCGLASVDKPVKRNKREVLLRLEELAQQNALIEKISGNTSLYTEELLEALANNPEMADFVTGYPTAAKSVTGGISNREKAEEYPLFLQWDPRWGYVTYGDDSIIGLAGCGPTSLSMALYYLTGDAELTPDKIAAYAMENGYYMPGTGTKWALLEDVPSLYGVSSTHPGISGGIMKRELDAGNIIICAMGPGEFTAAGHFIVIYGYDDDGFLINDPNCVARSRQHWTYQQFGGQIKQLWSLGR